MNSLRMGRTVRTASALAVAAGLLSACSSSLSGAQATDGTVTGAFDVLGGVAPGTARSPTPGTIELSAHGHVVASVPVPRSGSFRAQVPVGTYQVTGISSHLHTETSTGVTASGTCPMVGRSVTVTAGRSTTVEVDCVVP